MSLQGTLRTLGIAEVLEFLAGRKATGRLEITSDSGSATYWMSGGEIADVHFAFEREAGTDSGEATYYALSEIDGVFHFDEEQRPQHVEKTETVSDVLARTADIADGWAHVEEAIPTQHHWLTRSESLRGPVSIEPQWWTALAVIDDGCSPRELANALDMRALATSTMAAEMVRTGLLTVGEPVEATPEPEPMMAEDEAPLLHAVPDPDSSMAPVGDPYEHAPAPETMAGPIGFAATDPAEAAVPVPQTMADFPAEPAASVPVPAEPAPESAEHAAQSLQHAPEPAEHTPLEPEAETSPLGFGAAPDTSAEPSPFETSDWAEEAEPAAPSPALQWAEAEPAVDSAAAPEAGWDDDEDGWATDHSKSAAPVGAAPAAEEFRATPDATDVFGSAASADPRTSTAFEADEAASEVASSDEAPVESAEFGTDDRSSVLKFLRRD